MTDLGRRSGTFPASGHDDLEPLVIPDADVLLRRCLHRVGDIGIGPPVGLAMLDDQQPLSTDQQGLDIDVRAGDNFAFERDGVTPDILNLSKTLGAGLPLSATITSAAIEQDCYEKGYLFYTTHAADPLPAAVGRKVVEIVIRDGLAEKARDLGSYLKAQLNDLQQCHAIIGDVRGRGLLLGVELVADRNTKTPTPEIGAAISERCLELGACLNISRRGMAGVFRIAPPLTANRYEIDRAISIFDQALGECAPT